MPCPLIVIPAIVIPAHTCVTPGLTRGPGYKKARANGATYYLDPGSVAGMTWAGATV